MWRNHMSSTNRTPSAKGNRNILDFSDERRRDGLLRQSWNAITSGFKSKPEPKATWYETASGDVTPWRLVVNPIRAAIVQAVATGDKQLIETTLEGARAFCRELEADFASLVPSESEESILALALSETRHQGPADEATMALASSATCPTAAERAIAPLTAHLSSLVRLVDHCRRAARQPQVMRQW